MLFYRDQPKITVLTARVLASLADVFGEDIHSFLPDILRALVRAVADPNVTSDVADEVLVSTTSYIMVFSH